MGAVSLIFSLLLLLGPVFIRVHGSGVEVSNKYAEKGGTEAANFGEPAKDVNRLMFLNVGVQDSKSNIVDASTKVVPHVTYNTIVQEDT